VLNEIVCLAQRRRLECRSEFSSSAPAQKAHHPRRTCARRASPRSTRARAAHDLRARLELQRVDEIFAAVQRGRRRALHRDLAIRITSDCEAKTATLGAKLRWMSSAPEQERELVEAVTDCVPSLGERDESGPAAPDRLRRLTWAPVAVFKNHGS